MHVQYAPQLSFVRIAVMPFSYGGSHVYSFTPSIVSIQRRDAPVQLCQCDKFDVASSKIHKLGGTHD